MDKNLIAQIKEEIILSEMLAKDLERLWKSYAKKALVAKQERELKQEKNGFLECETEQELIDLYGYGDIDDETYYCGLDYFKNLKKPPELSAIEKYRTKLKELINREKGTIIELNEELSPTEKQPEENAFARYDRLRRKERVEELRLAEALGGTE